MTSDLNKFSELKKRLFSALLGASVIISSIVWSEWTYFLVFFTICILAQWEFYRLVRIQDYLPIRFWGVFIGGLLFILTFFIERGDLDGKYLFLLFPLASVIFIFKLYKKDDPNPFVNIALFYLGISYVALPFALINIIVFADGDYTYQILLGLMLIIWSSDTGAYFAGTAFGKTKLFERISPKKSWEGSLGGALVATGLAYIAATYFDRLNLWEWLIIAAIVVVAGTYGDLVESHFKRSMSIKDSGNSIPGHGGFLDRFDSLILAVPFIVVFLKLL
ncbi:MAG: phosphatidate cytidylyltransferase [Flammeovirgaceae bacterium]|jgi:phosphatidate cytidylyltransferase|nr:phosphatidate cytidylyltransferase [Flammeovirgaceae bacterium]|tara:strand:+ start:126498 stop:127328 length:831 start_codon:yes stop_codon:yes gene_type:complete